MHDSVQELVLDGGQPDETHVPAALVFDLDLVRAPVHCDPVANSTGLELGCLTQLSNVLQLARAPCMSGVAVPGVTLGVSSLILARQDNTMPARDGKAIVIVAMSNTDSKP